MKLLKAPDLKISRWNGVFKRALIDRNLIFIRADFFALIFFLIFN
jgi:hypothetical protein